MISPWALSWNDENYYLIGYDKEADLMKHYRVDKMGSIELTREERQEASFLKILILPFIRIKPLGCMGAGRKSYPWFLPIN